ncbi:MAG: hypothetical protein L0G22_07660 [Propionibacteriaceae bacterium]|nr:hypothetical protein [Propionibacteriaceae bacterium]
MTSWHPVQLQLTTDLGRGGRWTSLRAAGREWLWTNPDPAIAAARVHVGPGDAFVDAGGGEECFPCLRAPHDHGLVWNRPWRRNGDLASVSAEGHHLTRVVQRPPQAADAALVVTYTVSADTGRDVLHATHLLLHLSEAAELHPGPHGPLVFLDPRPDAEIDALGGEQAWVRALGRGRRGAVCYLLPDCVTVTVTDGDDALRLTLDADPGVPLAFVVWRNLAGWPADAPYRSIGVEPALGKDVSLPPARPGDAMRVGPDAPVTWRLTLEALRRDGSGPTDGPPAC